MDKVVHFEIPADNVARAKKFYEGVFGWKIEKFPMPEGEYWGIRTVAVDQKTRMPKEAGAINGGLMKRQGPAQHPVIAMNVDSIDAAIRKVEQAGGRVAMAKTAVANMGWYAYVRDTEGNLVGVWQSKKPAKRAAKAAKAKKR